MWNRDCHQLITLYLCPSFTFSHFFPVLLWDPCHSKESFTISFNMGPPHRLQCSSKCLSKRNRLSGKDHTRHKYRSLQLIFDVCAQYYHIAARQKRMWYKNSLKLYHNHYFQLQSCCNQVFLHLKSLSWTPSSIFSISVSEMINKYTFIIQSTVFGYNTSQKEIHKKSQNNIMKPVNMENLHRLQTSSFHHNFPISEKIKIERLIVSWNWIADL